ncbi:MAG TPA: NlpC/P60 family protein [Roseiflexaceae bacterium]|nr:NlpC/P60 family protein [Roseiflexaceae bacterium]
MRRPVTLILCALLLLSTLACGSAGVGMLPGVVDQVPRWACPTPTPLPFGPDGPIKSSTVISDGTQLITDTVFYERWEQEYGQLGGPPFPAPTPYTRTGTSFGLGQLVNLGADLDLQVDAQAGPVQADGQQLYVLRSAWTNRGAPVPLQPVRQLVLSAVQQGAAVRTGAWQASDISLRAAGLLSSTAVLSTTLPRGTTAITVPVLAPAGAPQTVSVRFDPPGAVDVTSASTFVVQFTATHEALCDHPGTVAAHYRAPAQPLRAPAAPIGTPLPGVPATGVAAQIIAFAVAQADDNRPYCWGGKGWDRCTGCDRVNGCVTPSCAAQGRGEPCWDCSGLTWGAYRAAGITIRHGTSGQSTYPAVNLSQVEPGDLLLYSGAPGGPINHVMLYAGDLDGDGTGDAVQALNWPAGTIISNNILADPRWAKRLVVITRPPRGGTP